MAFGFDPGIILAGRPANPLGAARSMAELLQTRQAMGIQQEQHQQTLASLLQKRQHEATLADIYRRNAGSPDAVAPALMGAGFGPEALDWTQGQSANRAREAAAEKAYRESVRQGAQFLGSQFRGVKDQRSLDATFKALEAAGMTGEQMAIVPRVYNAQSAPLFERLAALGISSEDEARIEETKRHNLEMEKRPSGIPPLTIIAGADGTQYLLDTRRPGAPAVPVTDEQGNPVAKAKPAKPVNQGDRDRLEALHVQARSAADLRSRFKDSFAGKGFLGQTVVAGKQALGSWASDADQEEAAFWADYAKMVDLPERNKTFGASLTATEKSSWENAKNIKPGASPQEVKRQMDKMEQIALDAARRRGRSLVKDGYSAEAIEEFTGPLGLDAEKTAAPDGPPPPGMKWQRNKKTGERRLVPIGG